MKSTKNIIILALLLAIVVMSVGYATFASQLKLNGTSEIVGQWDVKITAIDVENTSDGCDPGNPTFTNTSATFAAKLLKPGDTITYKITIQNAGTIDAKLENVLFTADEENGSPAIHYETSELEATLKKGATTTFTVTVTYDKAVEEVPSVKTKTITGIVEYVQQ